MLPKGLLVRRGLRAQLLVERRPMPTRRIFELVIITGVLLFPARATVRLWAKRQLGSQPEGTLLHGIGEVVVTVL